MKSPGIITLTTDFGLSDPYVGAMKGVILSINPNAIIVDISHQINAGSVFHASALLQETYPYFPETTIHVVVVDPGVGGDRRPILLKTRDYFFVGPDNGLFWPIIIRQQDTEIIHLTENKYFLPHISRTFHGRDVFAPVAAHLSTGLDPQKLGPDIDDPVPLEFPLSRQKGDALYGHIIRIDHFGNLVTNISRNDLKRFLDLNPAIIQIGNQSIQGVKKAYSEVKAGEMLALISSSDTLEIAVNLGRACDRIVCECENLIGMEIQVTCSK